ncbi:hypothetical protein ON010_g5964 [Phytophthora cinnamomi]|nr:hypothetical protein ON010_g5964 [Phytophthora cinnamomi]
MGNRAELKSALAVAGMESTANVTWAFGAVLDYWKSSLTTVQLPIQAGPVLSSPILMQPPRKQRRKITAGHPSLPLSETLWRLGDVLLERSLLGQRPNVLAALIR